MEQQENRYTVSAMRDLLKNLESIFEMVRLVDPTEVAVLRLEDNGTISMPAIRPGAGICGAGTAAGCAGCWESGPA